MKHRKLHATLALALLTAIPAGAAISYTTAGSSYDQDFDVLGSSDAVFTNNSTIEGWYLWKSGTGTNSTNTYLSSSGGAANPGRFQSLGDDSDRALGALSDSANMYYGMQIRNDTGFTLQSFTLEYTGEQWRVSNQGQDKLTFQYQIFDAGTTNELAVNNSTGWLTVSSLDFFSPQTGGTGTALDGNAISAELTGTANNLGWVDGKDLWIRWFDTSPQQVMGIDDIRFTAAIPEPSSALLGAIGALALLRRKR